MLVHADYAFLPEQVIPQNNLFDSFENLVSQVEHALEQVQQALQQYAGQHSTNTLESDLVCLTLDMPASNNHSSALQHCS
jgi:hypothetical protein